MSTIGPATRRTRARGAREGSHRAVHRRGVARRRPAAARSRSRIPRPADARRGRRRAGERRAGGARAPPPTRRPEWAAYPPRERGEILRRAYEAIVERTDELALLMTLEMGKSVAESRAEIAYAAEFFRWFSEEAVRIHGRYMVNTTGKGRLLTMRQPVGPCVFVTPWNFPMAMGTRKIAPAIAAGCTMVVKPAKQTPLSMLALAKILERGRAAGGRAQRDHRAARRRGDRTAAQGPAHAQAVVHRLDRGRALADRTVGASRCCACRWSSAATRRSWCSTTPTSTPRSTGAMTGEDAQHRRGVHGGQPLPRARVGRRRVRAPAGRADGRAEARPRHRARRRRRSADRRGPARQGRRARRRRRRARRATCCSAGSPVDGPGYFFEPTVLADVPEDARLLREEIFGPVAPIATFVTEEQAIDAANRTEYGLVAYVYTRDLDRAFRVCEATRDRHGRAQPGRRLEPRRAVRRRQAVRLRPRGRLRGDRRVPGDEVRRDGGLRGRGLRLPVLAGFPVPPRRNPPERRSRLRAASRPSWPLICVYAQLLSCKSARYRPGRRSRLRRRTSLIGKTPTRAS